MGEQKSVGHDVFQWGGGIGDAGRRLLNLMSTSGSCRIRAMNQGYARKILKRMEEVGLARHEGRLWYSTDRDLDEVARLFGTAGRGAARKVRNAARRARQRESIRRWKWQKDFELVNEFPHRRPYRSGVASTCPDTPPSE